jgi:microcystin-dependent protein
MDGYIGMILMWPIPYVTNDTAACNGNTLQVNQSQALYSLIGNLYGGTQGQNFKLPNLVNRFAIGSTNLGPGAVTGPNANIGGTGGAFQPTLTVASQGSISLQPSNMPAHSHSANFTPTMGNVAVTVSAPAAAIPVTIPVGTTAQSGPPANPLTGNVTLTNSVMTGASSGAFRGPFSTSPLAASTVNVTGGTASGNPGGSFTGNVSTVTGGNVTIGSTGAGTSVPFATQGTTAPVSLPPYLAINFIMLTAGIYPVRQD